MARYFSRPKSLWVDDEDAWPADVSGHIPDVPDHKATDTGLIDVEGNAIMRAPRPMGFIWEHD